MKKIALMAMVAGSIVTFNSATACELTDVIYYSQNNTNGEATGARLVGYTNFNGAEYLSTKSFEVYADGQLTDKRIGSVDGLEFFVDKFEYPVGETHTVEVVLTMEDDTVQSCESTFTIPADNAAPIIFADRLVHYDKVVETENGVLVTMLATALDTDGNLDAANVEYEFVEAPAGVEVPEIDVSVEEAGVRMGVYFQEIEFTVPGSYSLRVKATDASGEVAYSYPVEFTIGGECISSTINNHVAAGRAQEIFGSFFTTGAYVYLGYNNGGDTVALDLIEQMGEWWVICP